MNNLFKDLKPGEMVLAVPSFKLRGKAKYVFAMLNLLATTELLEDDVYWWAVRADILAHDRDLQPCLEISLRSN